MMIFKQKPEMVDSDIAIPGRDSQINPGERHFVNGNPIQGPWPDGLETAVFAAGCFWSVEEAFWRHPGVYSTAVGYVNGFTKNPTYEEVCTGMTGHTEAVLVVYDPNGTQYRSGIYATTPEQHKIAEESLQKFQEQLRGAGYGEITTEIRDISELDDFFFYAEDYHQQYLAKNPNGYRCASATGLTYAA
jgi:peptide-methionine (S)-S-oxide reductase